ncbi:MAG: sulfatase-like hydrolase/transferase [Verrucomicrobiae bacterium]|nr:sulfatase-like hydrolase/transferase [Verrucomicrobiae bacterium]
MTTIKRLPWFHLVLLSACSGLFATPPNIILILTDDQGWNNTQVPMIEGQEDTRSDFYLTPNMQRIADAGMTFSQAYAPHPVCSPSRHSIQQGISPAKLKKTTNVGSNYPDYIQTPTIPQILKKTFPEYRAAHFGKWHMWAHPAEKGYDFSDGRTGNQTGRQLSTDQTKFWVHEDPKRSESITDDAVEFIRHEAIAGNPFYLQVSHYFIHLSAEAHAATLEKHKARTPGKVHTAYWYAAMLDDLDQAVGRLLDVVEEMNLSDNTYIFFTSDNGGTARQYPGMNKPLRAGKGSYYEGGIRVPFMVTGPGIKAGTYSTVPVIGYDLLPTFARLAGVEGSLPAEIEGGSLVGVLKNQGRETVERERNGLYFSRQVDAVLIQGDNKLIRTHRTGELQLYNLAADLSETNDLSQTQPALRDQMFNDLKQWMDDNDVMTPSPDAPRGRRAQQDDDDI